MVYETAGLIALLVVLVIYVRLRKRNNKPEDNGLEAQTVELRQIRKQLQQANNLFATFVVQLLAEYKQIEAELNVATSENESLKQTVQELQQQLASVESERDEARKASTKLCLENTLLEQKVEQLESHKKVLIQELGGSLSGQDIEFITWEFLIQKVKEATNQLNEVITRNQSLIKTNRDLQQEKNILRSELNQVKDNNTKLTQDNSQLRANKNSLESELRQTLDRIKPLERAKDKLEQEKAQLERKLSESNQGNSKLCQAEAEIEQLEGEVEKLKQNQNNLERELKQEKAKLAPFEQKNKSLEHVINQLETAVKQEKSRVAVLERETNNLSTGKNENENTTDHKDKFLIKIIQLNQTIEQLKERTKQLEGGSDQYGNQPYILDGLDLLEQYNNLVYFVQESLNCSGIEELNYWAKTEEFYIELISRLCFIDTILITRIKLLEREIPFTLDENDNHTLAISFSYLGKSLFWSNSELRWELSSFFNSKL